MRISDWSSDVCSSDLYVGRRARLAVQEPANHNDIVEALGALDHAPGLHVQTTARLDHLAGLAQDLPLALDLLAAVAIVRGKPHRVDEIGERKSTRLNSSH